MARYRRYTTQIRMLWPADADWAAELFAHAKTRGYGDPAEPMFPTNSHTTSPVPGHAQ